MWANRKYPRTACIIVLTEEFNPRSPRPRMYSSTWARWIPARGASPLVSHQVNHCHSWYAYRAWVRPE